MQEVKNILVVKLSSIGDVVHSLPFLEVVKEKFPHARIDWLIEEESFQILNGHAAVDRVIVSRRKAWQKKVKKVSEWLPVLREAAQFLKELREYEYDLVVDLQGLFKSGILVGLSRGERKIGMAGAREGVPVDYDQHAVDRYMEMARYLGCRHSSWNGGIPVLEADIRMVKALLNSNGLEKTPFVAVNPMARWKTKLWKPESFAVLADRLCNELSCRIIFTGSGQDREVIKDISDMMKEKPLNLAGRTSLKELACLYAACSVLVTTDTGPMHIAAAMGCRVVALFGPTDPRRTGPYGECHEVIRADVECSPCFKKKCDHMSCMKQITVERCFEAVKKILLQGKPSRDYGGMYGNK